MHEDEGTPKPALHPYLKGGRINHSFETTEVDEDGETDSWITTLKANVLETGGTVRYPDPASIPRAETAATGPHAGVNTGMPIFIIGRTFLRIGQDLVSLLDLFKFLFRLRIFAVAIGVELHRQALICLLDLAIFGIALHTQYFIKVAF